jgi:hypothetical protein
MRRTIGGQLLVMVKHMMRDVVILHGSNVMKIACTISSRSCIA